MKKNFALLCCFVMLFSIVSCGDSKEKLVTAPTEDYVIECLEKVPGILEIEAVTEDTDPMKNLNKPGWYTAHVYFSYELVNQDDVYGDDLIDKGTDAGGSIEVYKTKSEANERNEYLSAFDGGVLDSGSHTVVGTLVVRTSDELTASQQKTLETNIIAALTGDLDAIVTPSDSSPNANVNYIGTFYMEDFANSHIDISSDNTLTIYDADDRLNLEGYYDSFSYIYIPANDSDYENTYAMLKVDLSVLYPNESSHFEFIHILDDFTIMYNGYKFSN